MKIVLTKLRLNLFLSESYSTPDLSLYKINSILRRSGFDSEVLDPFILQYKMRNNLSIMDIFNKYDCIAISVTSTDWALNVKFIEAIKKHFPDKLIIIGGVHAEYFPEHSLKVSKADICYIGEAESRLPKLFDYIENSRDLSDINGIVYKKDGKIVSTGKPVLLDLENEILSYDLYKDMPNCIYSSLPFESSRGCYGNCRFCSIKYKINWRKYCVNQVVGQLNINMKYTKKLKGELGYSNHIFFVDDCLTGHRDHGIELIKVLKDLKSNYRYAFEARVNDLLFNEELLELLSAVKLQYIEAGVESGYEEGMINVNKGTNIRNVIKLADLTKKYHINTIMKYSFIVGFPWENKDQCLKTIDFANKLANDYGSTVSVGWYVLYPSWIYENRNQYNINRDASMYDELYWFADEELFFETHGNLSSKDVVDIEKYVNTLNNKNILSSNWKKAREFKKELATTIEIR